MGGARFASSSSAGEKLRREPVSPTSSDRCSTVPAWGGNGSRIRSRPAAAIRINDIFSMFGRPGRGARRAYGAGAGSPYGAYEQAAQPEDGEDRNSKISLTFRQAAVRGDGIWCRWQEEVQDAYRRCEDGQKIRLAGKGFGRNGGRTAICICVPSPRSKFAI